MQDFINNEVEIKPKIDLPQNQENINKTIERFFSGDKIELRKSGFAGFKVCWFGGKYQLGYPIDENCKEKCFRQGDWDYVNKGVRVLLLDEKEEAIGHADWRVSEHEKWVVVNGNKPSISPWITQSDDIPNFDLKEKTTIKGNWTNGIDLQEEFQGKGLGKLLIALRLLILLKINSQNKDVFIDLQGAQREIVQKIYEYFIPKYREIRSQRIRIRLEEIDWNKVNSTIDEWLT